MPPAHMVHFRRNAEKTGTFHRREWCSAQRIRITMIASGNHSIILMNASPTVFFQRFLNGPTNTNLSVCRMKLEKIYGKFTQGVTFFRFFLL